MQTRILMPLTMYMDAPAELLFIDSHARRLYLAMSLRADSLGVVQCSLDSIARMMGRKAGGGSLTALLRTLQRDGFVSVSRPSTGSRATVYRVNR